MAALTDTRYALAGVDARPPGVGEQRVQHLGDPATGRRRTHIQHRAGIQHRQGGRTLGEQLAQPAAPPARYAAAATPTPGQALLQPLHRGTLFPPNLPTRRSHVSPDRNSGPRRCTCSPYPSTAAPSAPRALRPTRTRGAARVRRSSPNRLTVRARVCPDGTGHRPRTRHRLHTRVDQRTNRGAGPSSSPTRRSIPSGVAGVSQSGSVRGVPKIDTSAQRRAWRPGGRRSGHPRDRTLREDRRPAESLAGVAPPAEAPAPLSLPSGQQRSSFHPGDAHVLRQVEQCLFGRQLVVG